MIKLNQVYANSIFALSEYEDSTITKDGVELYIKSELWIGHNIEAISRTWESITPRRLGRGEPQPIYMETSDILRRIEIDCSNKEERDEVERALSKYLGDRKPQVLYITTRNIFTRD
jgi:hypothetical protein